MRNQFTPARRIWARLGIVLSQLTAIRRISSNLSSHGSRMTGDRTEITQKLVHCLFTGSGIRRSWFYQPLAVMLSIRFTTVVHRLGKDIGLASRLTLLQRTACICAGLLVSGYLPSPALAQTIASCQTTKTPALFPYIADNSSEGWAPNLSASAARASFAVGDIDGDGNDELVTVPPVPQTNQLAMAQVSHWNRSGWTAMNSISNATIMGNLPQGSAITISTLEVHLANVDGGGQKEVIVDINWGSNSGQEQVYKYNASTGIWTLLSAYTTNGTSSMWMTVSSTSTQAVRVTVDSSLSSLEAATWSGSQWSPASYSPITLKNEKLATGCSHGIGLQGYCVAFGDVTGDGLTDLLYLGNDPNYNNYLIPSVAGKPFGGTETFAGLQIHQTIDNQIQDWQLADVDGNGVSELLIPDTQTITTPAGITVSGALQVNYWNSTSFVAVADPNFEVSQTATALGPLVSLEAVPMPIMVTNYDPSGNHPAVAAARGVAAIGKAGVYLLEFTNSGGTPTYPGVYDFSEVPILTTAISTNNGFGPTSYSQFFKFAVEGSNLVLVARSAAGIVNQMNGTIQNQAVTGGTVTTGTVGVGSAFVDPATLTDRGYPLYTASQAIAYESISHAATGNPDIRSLYTDPAVPWPEVQYKVETLTTAQTPAGVSAADFQTVQAQTLDEITAVQSVNQMYGVTGQILTNTYLVKDATLSQVTDLLGLPSDPDVTGQVINEVTSVLSGFGGLLAAVGSVVQLASDAATIATIVNNISAASNVLYVMAGVTGDIATYTAGTPPPNTASGSYSLKNSLDNSSLAVAAANTCHQSQALSAWNQSKPIADGVLTGSVPLNLGVQQDILQASQSLFEITVWQQLAPTKWDYYTVYQPSNPGGYFKGDPNYFPPQAVVTAIAPPPGCSPPNIPTHYGDLVYGVSFILADPSTNNWPNLTALQALFLPPPQGFGANALAIYKGTNGWAFNYGAENDKLTNNIFDNNNDSGYISVACDLTSLLIGGTFTIPLMRTGDSVTSSPVAPRSTAQQGPDASAARLVKLLADVKADLTDPAFRDRLAVYLDVARTRLRQARQHNNEPTETLRLLNLFIAESQWHAGHDFRDSEISRTESIEAVAIRDSLIEPMEVSRAQ